MDAPGAARQTPLGAVSDFQTQRSPSPLPGRARHRGYCKDLRERFGTVGSVTHTPFPHRFQQAHALAVRVLLPRREPPHVYIIARC